MPEESVNGGPAVATETNTETEELQRSARTLRDEIRRVLSAKGISEAVGFEVTLKSGENFTILSDTNPRMDTPAELVSSVQIKQAARAGGVNTIALLFS